MAREMGRVERLRAALRDANERLREQKDRALETIEDHPYESVAVAFGVGILAGLGLGYLMRKK
ncbi:MAG: hypothetical protein QW331_03630 [Candidatus Woesearchaeota archaeon]